APRPADGDDAADRKEDPEGVRLVLHDGSERDAEGRGGENLHGGDATGEAGTVDAGVVAAPDGGPHGDEAGPAEPGGDDGDDDPDEASDGARGKADGRDQHDHGDLEGVDEAHLLTPVAQARPDERDDVRRG